MPLVGSVYPPNYDASITGTVVAGDGSLVLGSPGVQFGTPSLRALVGPLGVSSAQSFGAIKTKLAFKVGSVSSPSQFGTLIVTHPQTIPILGCPSAQQFSSTIRFNQIVHVTGLQHTVIPYLTGQYLTGQINVGYELGHGPQFVTPNIYTIVRVPIGGVASAQQFGLAKAAQIVHPLGLGSAQQFGTRIGIKFRLLGVPPSSTVGKPKVFRVYLHIPPLVDVTLPALVCQDVVLTPVVCRDVVLVPSPSP
jgi:hypothetical protein